MNEIPNFKVGTDLKEVANYVKANVKDSTVQQSIFNMIEDDSKFGDGKISDKGELQILKNLLSGTKNMPTEVQAEEATTIKNSDTGISIEKVNEDGSMESSEYGIYEKDIKNRSYRHSTDDAVDSFVDMNNDGTMDKRFYYKKEGGVCYIDQDANGTFDTKTVRIDRTEYTYERAEDGEWKLTGERSLFD